MKKFIFIFVLGIALIGCKGIADDYKLGKNTPLAEGETSPHQKGEAFNNTLAGIPYANIVGIVLSATGATGYIFTWLRGRRLRKEKMPLNENPITGAIGRRVGAEALVQHLAEVAAGVFDVGHKNGLLKPGWKGAILAGIGTIVAPELSHLITATVLPALQNNPPEFLANLFNGSVLAMTIGGLMAADRWLQQVEPLAPKPVAQ